MENTHACRFMCTCAYACLEKCTHALRGWFNAKNSTRNEDLVEKRKRKPKNDWEMILVFMSVFLLYSIWSMRWY